MRFEIPSTRGSFEIPDDWWKFVGMEDFVPSPGGYYPYSDLNGVEEIVPLAEIEPPQRGPGVQLFRKYKLVPVLFAFQSPECALPPVQVSRIEKNPFRYLVRNGFHRFYASVAVGYSNLPVIIVPD